MDASHKVMLKEILPALYFHLHDSKISTNLVLGKSVVVSGMEARWVAGERYSNRTCGNSYMYFKTYQIVQLMYSLLSSHFSLNKVFLM